MLKRKTFDSSSKKFVQQKLSEIFPSTKRDNQKKKLKQTIGKNESEEPVASAFIGQKSHSDESEDETFDQDDDATLMDEYDVSREASPYMKSEPEELLKDVEIRSKLTFHDDDFKPINNLLHAFDLNYKFGPCVGLKRLERWERAHKLGLNPPKEVKDTLTSKLNEPIFYGRI